MSKRDESEDDKERPSRGVIFSRATSSSITQHAARLVGVFGRLVPEARTRPMSLLPASERQISVTHVDNPFGMAIIGADRISGTALRHAICVCLLDAKAPLTLAEVVARLEELAVLVPGRASKTVSDALRWEVRHGRAIRLRRSVYQAGSMPRSTEWWIRRQVAAHVGDCRSEAGKHGDTPLLDGSSSRCPSGRAGGVR